MSNENLADEIELLQQEYRDGLSEKLQAAAGGMKPILEAIKTTGTSWSYDQNQWKPLVAHCHKIAGSAGTYGFKVISETTRFLEDRTLDGSLLTLTPDAVARLLCSWHEFYATAVHTYSEIPSGAGFGKCLQAVNESLITLWRCREKYFLEEIDHSKNTRRAA